MVPCRGREQGAVTKKLSCQEVLDQLWEYLDEDARAELRAEIDSHVNGCRHCQMEVDSLQSTIKLYRNDEPVAAPIQLSDRLFAALRDAYKERGGCSD